MAEAMSSALILDRPTAVDKVAVNYVTYVQAEIFVRTVNLVRLARLAAEHALLEHLEAADSEPFASSDRFSTVLRPVLPVVARTGIHQNAHDHQVDESSRLFERRNVRLVPSREKRVDAVADEVSPSTVRRDRVVVGPEIARDEAADKVDNLRFAGKVERPVVELVFLGECKDAGAALSDRRKGSQVRGEVAGG